MQKQYVFSSIILQIQSIYQINQKSLLIMDEYAHLIIHTHSLQESFHRNLVSVIKVMPRFLLTKQEVNRQFTTTRAKCLRFITYKQYKEKDIECARDSASHSPSKSLHTHLAARQTTNPRIKNAQTSFLPKVNGHLGTFVKVLSKRLKMRHGITFQTSELPLCRSKYQDPYIASN